MIKQRNLDSLNKMNVNIYVLKLKNLKDWVMGLNDLIEYQEQHKGEI